MLGGSGRATSSSDASSTTTSSSESSKMLLLVEGLDTRSTTTLSVSSESSSSDFFPAAMTLSIVSSVVSDIVGENCFTCFFVAVLANVKTLPARGEVGE